jgi:hypothetical protein
MNPIPELIDILSPKRRKDFRLTLTDFDHLSHSKMAWREYGADWQKQNIEGRFDPEAKNMNYKTAYWYSNYPAVLLAKMYLEQEGIKYETFSDEWSSDWVIVTDADSIQ